MRDQWVGDIGDFAKYGLLRHLCGVTGPSVDNPPSLGIIWYYQEGRVGGDGNTNYLRGGSPLCKIINFDPYLYKAIQRLVEPNCRTVYDVQNAKIFPSPSTKYFINPVGTGIRGRPNWFKCAKNAMQGAELVFLDPDNGSQPSCTSKSRGPKHVRIEEVEELVAQDKSLVIYQHVAHGADTELIRLSFASTVIARLGRPIRTFQWGSRYFFIIPSENRENYLLSRLNSFEELWDFTKVF